VSPASEIPEPGSEGPQSEGARSGDPAATGAALRVRGDAPAFEVLEELGRGGAAVVERVRLTEPCGGLESGAFAARKRLAGNDDDARTSLETEIRVASDVATDVGTGCETLVRLVASWRGARGPELLFGLIEGVTLERWLVVEEGPLPEPIVRRLGADLARALERLHAAGWAHGDLSLANARVDADDRAILLDLGQARRIDADEDGPSSGDGTLAYLAPERAIGGPASAAADVFALGVALYWLATGRHPFAPDSFVPGLAPPDLSTAAGERVLGALAAARYLPPSRLVPQISPLLDTLLAEMLDRRPNQRPAPTLVAEILEQGEDHTYWRRERSERGGHVAKMALQRDPFALPLVGRSRELEQIESAFRYCLDESTGGSVVVVAGPKGSGRSRLVHHFVDRSRRSLSPPIFLYARSSDESESRPHGAALRLLERWLMLEPGSQPSAYEIEMLRHTVPPREADVLASALDPKGRSALSGSVGRALVRWVRALVAERPTILFVDDLHAARSSTLATVDRLVDALADTRAMVVLGYSEEVAPARPRALRRLLERIRSRPACERELIRLDPLTLDEVRTIVTLRFCESEPTEELASVLWQRSRGNPGLLTELLRALFERGQIGEDERGRWQLAIPPRQIPEPRSVEQGIAERIEGLESSGRKWLERLTVLPSRIDPTEALSVFGGGRRSELDRALSLLVRRGWLEPTGPRYRFARPALREGVYASIPDERRARLHRLVAQSLDRSGPDGEPTLDDRFARARHLRAAGEHRALVRHLDQLLPDAQRQASPLRVLRLARWALESLDNLPESISRSEALLRFLEAGAAAAGRTGARAGERELLDRLAAVQPDAAQRPDAAARLYYLHGRALADTGQLGVARGLLRAAITASELDGSPALLGRSLRLMSLVQLRSGCTDLAREVAERALEQAEHDWERAACAVLLGSADLLEDRIEDALARASDAQHFSNTENEAPLWLVPHVQLLRARVLRVAGRPGRALGALNLALEGAQQANERPLEAEILARIANVEMEARDFVAAQEHLVAARELAEETETPYASALATVWLGALAWERDDPAASGLLETAVRSARDAGHYRAEAVARSLLARRHVLAGEAAAAETESKRAITIVERHGAELFDRILVAGSRSVVLRRLGRHAEADALETELRRRIEFPTPPIRDEALIRTRSAYALQLLDGVLTTEGPIHPSFRP
jgi:serine/threonine protein kinase/tetratricopeptide (TPR) repeat protein